MMKIYSAFYRSRQGPFFFRQPVFCHDVSLILSTFPSVLSSSAFSTTSTSNYMPTKPLMHRNGILFSTSPVTNFLINCIRLFHCFESEMTILALLQLLNIILLNGLSVTYKISFADRTIVTPIPFQRQCIIFLSLILENSTFLPLPHIHSTRNS